MAIRSFWSNSTNNFGDTLTPWLLSKLGYKSKWVKRGAPNKLLAVGSIIQSIVSGDIVWGSGSFGRLRKGLVFLNIPENVIFLAVRGPKTKNIFNPEVRDRIPNIFGDPGLLVSSYYKPTIKKQYKIGIIPHEIEKDIQPINDSSIKWIDINSGIKQVIDDINSCEIILSSSLHGIIAAESYGIPTGWIKMSDKIIGNTFKFQDYYLSTGRNEQKFIKWEGRSTLLNVDKKLQDQIDLNKVSQIKDVLTTAFYSHYRR